MNITEICRFLGHYLFYFALVLLIPIAASAILYDPPCLLAFVQTFWITLLLAALLFFFGKRSSKQLHRKESILLVALIWFISAGLGALPFLLTKTLESPIDAYFEAMSGLTTTGATILHPKAYDPLTGAEITISCATFEFYGTVAPVGGKIGIEAVARPLLFWRSLMQWLGGMGIVVLFITVLPALSMGGKLLFEAEVPGPSKESLTPRVKETAGLLWKIYLGFTLLQIILLLLTNPSLSLFDATALSFSTISTGGFTIYNSGLSAYNSTSIEMIVLAFMIIGSLNFTLYFHCLKGKIYRIYEPEFLIYLLSLFIGTFLLAWSLHHENVYSWKDALRYGAFQAVSAQSSTGFAVRNFNLWPLSSQLILFLAMFVGGMSGSTSGGMKMARVWILVRTSIRRIETIFRPESIRILKMGEKEITDKTALNTLIFFCILILLVVLGSCFLILDGLEPTTAISMIASLINNAGLSLGETGPIESCAFLSPFSKIIAILWMALGRLEFFILLVLLVPTFWKRRV